MSSDIASSCSGLICSTCGRGERNGYCPADWCSSLNTSLQQSPTQRGPQEVVHHRNFDEASEDGEGKDAVLDTDVIDVAGVEPSYRSPRRVVGAIRNEKRPNPGAIKTRSAHATEPHWGAHVQHNGGVRSGPVASTARVGGIGSQVAVPHRSAHSTSDIYTRGIVAFPAARSGPQPNLAGPARRAIAVRVSRAHKTGRTVEPTGTGVHQRNPQGRSASQPTTRVPHASPTSQNKYFNIPGLAY